MVIQWSDEDDCFIVTLPEFDDVKTHGDTYEEAVQMGKELIESCTIWNQHEGKPLPKPRTFIDTAA
jgi:predicted RNase H-like HicB family nuclease